MFFDRIVFSVYVIRRPYESHIEFTLQIIQFKKLLLSIYNIKSF
jgi:hypothetical protein